MSTTDHGNVNLRWACALVKGLVSSGVRHVVISPGSRSTPLVLACAECPHLRIWVQPDERCAAFFALGIGRGRQGPTAVIATSGTAPANWYPAVIEASQDLQPLILVSADRPVELQDCGASQTIDQTRLFGNHVRGYFALSEPRDSDEALRHTCSVGSRAGERCRWPLPGPVHINVPYHEPLVPVVILSRQNWNGAVRVTDYPSVEPAPEDVNELAKSLSGRRGLIAVGRNAYSPALGGALSTLARKLSCPVLVDPLSGLRFGAHDRSRMLTHYDAFLRRHPFVDSVAPEWVLHLGGVLTSAFLQQYLEHTAPSDVALIVPYGPWPDPGHRATRVLHADPLLLVRALAAQELHPATDKWLDAFLAEEERAAELSKRGQVPLEAEVIDVIARNSASGTVIFAGNSTIIRDMDDFLSGGSQDLTLVGKRGASGIDGNVSIVLGIAAATTRKVVGLIGDLALYHDMNGLLAARDVNALLIVFNNGGGAIFSYLPQAGLADFERYWLTPTGLELEQVAYLYGLRHRRVSDAQDFELAFDELLDTLGTGLIEVMIDREESVRRHKEYWDRVVAH